MRSMPCGGGEGTLETLGEFNFLAEDSRGYKRQVPPGPLCDSLACSEANPFGALGLSEINGLL